MKLNKFFTVSALALASVAFMQTAASASVSASVGDIILGFDDASGTVNSDYEVDLGSFSLYSTPGYSNSNISNIGADLSSAFGSTWASNSTIEWSVAGTNGATSSTRTLYLGAGAGITPNAPINSSSNNTAAGIINSYTLALNNSTSTANNAQGTLQFTNSTPNGFTLALNNNLGYGQSQFFPATAVTDTDGTAETTTLELWEMSNTAHTAPIDIGTFTLDGATGEISFVSATQAPEPSTYALLGLGALALLFVQRRSIKA